MAMLNVEKVICGYVKSVSLMTWNFFWVNPFKVAQMAGASVNSNLSWLKGGGFVLVCEIQWLLKTEDWLPVYKTSNVIMDNDGMPQWHSMHRWVECVIACSHTWQLL